jgi:D-allulose-6-phosphate 3-epimerase
MKLLSTSMMVINPFELESKFSIIDEQTDLYHIDIMDGHFVPNLALSFDFIKQLRKKTNKPIDVHLMMEHPENFVDILIENKVDSITFHPNVIERSVFRLIDKIKSKDIQFGIALSPHTTIDQIKYYQSRIDKITIMTVEPGFAGQSVIPEMITKIKEVKDYRQTHDLAFMIEVDGSNNYSTFDQYVQNGADILILGSLLNKDDLKKTYENIKSYIGQTNE